MNRIIKGKPLQKFLLYFFLASLISFYTNVVHAKETIDLAPVTSINFVGDQHVFTATVFDDTTGNPIQGKNVTYKAFGGPHFSQIDGVVAGPTGADGKVRLTITGRFTGTDTVEASFVDSQGNTITSNRVTKEWIERPAATPTPKGTPTAISLLYFKARPGIDGNIILTWETATEIDNAGFNLYRSRSNDGIYEKINSELIDAEGNAVSGASYQFMDTPPSRGTYYYKLEDVDYNGMSTMHGPIRVRVRSADNEAHRR